MIIDGYTLLAEQRRLLTETWLPVVGWEGLYEVSDQGRVRGLARTVMRIKQGQVQELRRKPRMLKPRVKWSGHVEVKLYNSGTNRTIHVHKLVAEAFLGPCPEGMECCHDNDVPDDNRVENLRYDTRKANQLDAVRNGHNMRANQTHCLREHEFTAENTYAYLRNGNPRRACRECMKIRERKQGKRSRQEAVV